MFRNNKQNIFLSNSKLSFLLNNPLIILYFYPLSAQMANTSKNKKTTPPPVSEIAPVSVDKKTPDKLGFGILFMLIGVFACFSIISYFFTWKADQDKVFNVSLFQFLFHDQSLVENWGGRLGAALSHILVYKGVGIAALAVGMGIAAIGLHMIYGKRAAPLLRYMRWLSLLLLLTAPVLAYLVPDNPFPLGGALGRIAIYYLDGLLGYAGTGMVLLSTVLFFIFVIFALDIRPFLHRMSRTPGIWRPA